MKKSSSLFKNICLSTIFSFLAFLFIVGLIEQITSSFLSDTTYVSHKKTPQEYTKKNVFQYVDRDKLFSFSYPNNFTYTEYKETPNKQEIPYIKKIQFETTNESFIEKSFFQIFVVTSTISEITQHIENLDRIENGKSLTQVTLFPSQKIGERIIIPGIQETAIGIPHSFVYVPLHTTPQKALYIHYLNVEEKIIVSILESLQEG